MLFLLKMRGPQTSADIGAALKITGEAARQQLLKLAEDGLVEAQSESRGVGRPVQLWKLSALGHARFPDTHGELTVRILDSMRTVLGNEALDRVLASREEDAKRTYMEHLSAATTLEERVIGLAEIRSREGYMAEWRHDGEAYWLIENHCPICAAAAACVGFCRSELNIFQQVLGSDVEIQRAEHILAGARRCAYRIVPKPNPAQTRFVKSKAKNNKGHPQ